MAEKKEEDFQPEPIMETRSETGVRYKDIPELKLVLIKDISEEFGDTKTLAALCNKANVKKYSWKATGSETIRHYFLESDIKKLKKVRDKIVRDKLTKEMEDK